MKLFSENRGNAISKPLKISVSLCVEGGETGWLCSHNRFAPRASFHFLFGTQLQNSYFFRLADYPGKGN